MRATEFITELRDPLLNWLKGQFPSWPDYVLYDFLYRMCKGMTSQHEVQEYIQEIKTEFGEYKWQLKNIKITLDVFSKDTQRRMAERDMGKSNPYKIHNDEERHLQQQKMIATRGVSKEPIIVLLQPDGYELLEGWHRTLQHLQAFPNGYVGPAWVGVK